MALDSGAVVEVNPDPGTVDKMPVRPYRVLHAGLPFYSDAECRNKVEGASLIVVKSEDPAQSHQVVECIPTRKRYTAGQVVRWELNKEQIWGESWYRNPESGKIEKVWVQSVEFAGPVVV